MRPKEHYDDLRATVGWSLHPQITVKGSGTVYFSKEVDFSIYPECYPKKELNEWPINPFTKEKLKQRET